MLVKDGHQDDRCYDEIAYMLEKTHSRFNSTTIGRTYLIKNRKVSGCYSVTFLDQTQYLVGV